ncbi:DUF1828 domain-containing protein [Synechococcus moorigangaii CMS01]|nr:DUF1828 domain-containing protein [Synechococcus moorigangaii CMS01]
MTPERLQKILCNTFCDAFNVRAVPVGLAVSTPFVADDGDRISFYVRALADELVLEDDGSFLAHLVAANVPFDQGTRGALFDAILSEGGAFWDRDTLEIKTPQFPEHQLGTVSIRFISALLRARDLQNLTRDMVRSTFREDALSAMSEVFQDRAKIAEDVPIDRDFREFPADIVVRPTIEGPKTAAVYLVNSNDKLNEALLCKLESDRLLRNDVIVIALLEDSDMRTVSRKRFQRAQNRSLLMPIFRGDEHAAIHMIGSNAGFSNLKPAIQH